MYIDRFVIGFSISIVLCAVGYAARVAGDEPPDVSTPAVAQPSDPKALAKKLVTLDARLQDAQTRIDELVIKLANTSDDSVRDATRVRLDVLYRLERGLVADIARTRSTMQSLAGARVMGAWQSHDSKNR
jgi:hypothetical protein